jgi:predicted nucleic acid-binding protein
LNAIIDTNIAIHLRDRDREILERLANFAQPLMLSIITQVELEGGVPSSEPDVRARRRASLDELLADLPAIDFNAAAASAYADIVAVTGYSRSRTLDRMIAATAIANNASLITINGKHFRDIPDLDLIEWDSPSPA